MSGPVTSGGAGSAGAVAAGAIASSVYNDNSSQTTDASQHLGLQTGAGAIGATTSLVGSDVQNLTLTDAGAIAAGQAIALSAINANAQGVQSLAADAQYAIGQASSLAKTAAEGQGGLLVKAVFGIAALGVVGWGLSAYFSSGSKSSPKKKDD